MTVAPVYKQGWTMDDVHWSLFDPSKVDPTMLCAVKAAALVEYNAPDYVTYLKRVFAGQGPEIMAALEQWGREEAQHGRALGRWAEIADPGFNMEEAFIRFRRGYTPAHFAAPEDGSIRGSRRGEMVARCVVESGTSSYYSAIRDASEEPVLKEIAGRIAADEYRHYKLFYDTLNAQAEPDISFWKKLWIALGRVRESDDDELAFSYYCANVPREKEAITPYHRKKYSHLAGQASMTVYHRHHVQKLVQMVIKVVGADPHGWLANLTGALLWRRLSAKSA
ncbi:MAG: ferritin-like domain-containing protein [Alphaproteobacteria bacterium]|nr:ferritin-like domain-containing protein [Alphaproteobacteria bacterium]